MLTGYDENGNIRNVKVTENGEVLIKQKRHKKSLMQQHFWLIL